MTSMRYPRKSITILTSYNGQKALIRDVVEQRCARNPAYGRPHKITTVDKYQGQQNDCTPPQRVRYGLPLASSSSFRSIPLFFIPLMNILFIPSSSFVHSPSVLLQSRSPSSPCQMSSFLWCAPTPSVTFAMCAASSWPCHAPVSASTFSAANPYVIASRPLPPSVPHSHPFAAL